MFTDKQRHRLEHIADNAERIAGYVEGLTFDEFAASPMVLDAVERCLARITEAAIRAGEEVMAQVAPDVPPQFTAASATPCGMITTSSTPGPCG